MPYWMTLPMITILAIIIVARLLLVSKRQLDRSVTQILIWWLCAAVLRESWFQQAVITHSDLTLSDIRLVTHASVIASSVAVYLVVRSWSLRPVQTRTVIRLYCAGLVAAVVLGFLSAPARAQGIAVEELHSWRTAVYMIIYSAPMPLALFAVVKWCVRLYRRPESTRSLRRWLVIVIAACTVSLYDHLSRMANGVMLSLNWHNALTELRSQSNDILFLPAATSMAIVLAIPAIAEAKVRLRSDSSSRAVRRLEDMWNDLVTMEPKVSVESVGVFHSSLELEHRMLIECEDALFLVLPYMSPEALSGDVATEDRVKAITDAMRLYKAGDSDRALVAPPEWLVNEEEMLRIADAWART